jgi:hypothetical protein
MFVRGARVHASPRIQKTPVGTGCCDIILFPHLGVLMLRAATSLPPPPRVLSVAAFSASHADSSPAFAAN